MRKGMLLTLGFFLVLGLFLPGVGSAASSNPFILEFRTMVGVSGPFVGPTNPIRDVPGGGLPWTLSEGRGTLRADGQLRVRVKGLVLAAGPSEGTNPVSDFRAIVSCQTIDEEGDPAIVNLSTGDFPATPTGDADIRETLELPSPCFAPIIFVTNPQGRWFAVTGF